MLVRRGERIRVRAAEVEHAEQARLRRERDDHAGGEAVDRRRAGERRQVVRQAHHQDGLRRDAVDEPRVELAERDADERLGLRPRPDDPADGRAVEQQEAELVERHELAELVDGRLHDLFEVETGGRPRRDVVEQPGLAGRLLLALEQGGVVDRERRRVADGGGRVELRLRERPLGIALDEFHRADHPVLDDQRQRRPALVLVVLVDLVDGRREPRIAQRSDRRRPLRLDHFAGHRGVLERQPLPDPLLVHAATGHAHERVQLGALDHRDLTLVDAHALAQAVPGGDQRGPQVEVAGELERRFAHQRHTAQVLVQLPVERRVGDRLARHLREPHHQLLVGERPGLPVGQGDEADDVAVADQRHVKRGCVAPVQRILHLHDGHALVVQDVRSGHGAPGLESFDEGAVVGDRIACADRVRLPGADRQEDLDLRAVHAVHVAEVGAGDLDEALGGRPQHGVHVERGAELEARVREQPQVLVAALEALHQHRLLERAGEQPADVADQVQVQGEVPHLGVEHVDEADRSGRRPPAAARPCCG